MNSNNWNVGVAAHNGVSLGQTGVQSLASRLESVASRILHTDRVLDDAESRLLGGPSSYLSGEQTDDLKAGVAPVGESVAHIEKLLNTLQERASRIVSHIG